MPYTCSQVRIKTSNFKQTEYNKNDEKKNPRIVITLNEFHLTKWMAISNRKRKIIHVFKDPISNDTLTEMPLRIWITPENTLYQFLMNNREIDGWFQLDLEKIWGNQFNITKWSLNERMDKTINSTIPQNADNQVQVRQESRQESRQEKLTRIASIGFNRIFTKYPAFLQLVSKQELDLEPDHIKNLIAISTEYPLCELHQKLISYFLKRRSAEELEKFQKDLVHTFITADVMKFLCDKNNLDAPLLAGLKPLKFTDQTRDIVTEKRPFPNNIKVMRLGTDDIFFDHIGTHFEYAVQEQDIIPRLLDNPFSLCLDLHIPFKQVDQVVQYENLYSQEDLVNPDGNLLTERIASRLVQQLRTHPLNWTAFNALKVGDRQDHHEMLEDLGIPQDVWDNQVKKISTISNISSDISDKDSTLPTAKKDNKTAFRKLMFFDKSENEQQFNNQVALTSDVEKEETIIRMLSQNSKYEINEALLQKHIERNFTQKNRILDEDQEKAIRILLGNQNAILCGPGGSGKTTIIKTVLDYLQEDKKGKDLVIEAVAPTGKAAVNLQKSIKLEASTCHKVVFGGNRKNKKKKSKSQSQNDLASSEKEKQIDILVIDEVSMLDTLVAGHLFQLVEATKIEQQKNPYKQRIFLLGDTNQLSPVGCGQIFLDLERFQTKLGIPFARLTKIHRYGKVMTDFNGEIINYISASCLETQKNNETHRPLKPMDLSRFNVNNGQKSEAEVISFYDMPTYVGNKDYWIQQTLTLYHEINQRLNQEYEQNESQSRKRKTMFLCTLTNEFCHVMNPLIQDKINPILDGEIQKKYDSLKKSNSKLAQFRIGDKVVHTVNWYDPDIVMNGHFGIVVGLDFTKEVLEVKFDTQKIKYTKQHFQQFPNCLVLGYCTTIHKAQGDGYNEVIYVLNSSFGGNARACYTACTRSIEKLTIVTNQDLWNKQLQNKYENRHSKMAYDLTQYERQVQ